MRVVGVHPARDPVPCGEGPVRIGGAPDDHIVAAGDAEPHHVTLACDARGLTLTVRAGCRRVYVNARAVRERCLLRYGDTVTLGASRFLITSDAEPPPAPPHEDAVRGPARPALRIVSGTRSGQLLRVAPELRLGTGTRHFGDLAYACRVVQAADGLAFESDSALPRVNGWRRNRTRLASGDQIVLGEHRLVVEAPAPGCAAHDEHLPPRPNPVAAPEASDDVHPETWWLIAVAAVVAVIIAMLLYFRW